MTEPDPKTDLIRQLLYLLAGAAARQDRQDVLIRDLIELLLRRAAAPLTPDELLHDVCDEYRTFTAPATVVAADMGSCTFHFPDKTSHCCDDFSKMQCSDASGKWDERSCALLARPEEPEELA